MTQKAQNHYLITKHNDLIEAKYRLSLQEQRVIAFLTAEINPDDEDFKSYRFKIRDFAELIGLEGQNYYSELKKVTRNLISRVLTIKRGNELIQVAWLSSAKYHETEGWVELKFAPELKPYLLKLKECFTQYQLGEILKLRSKYAFRLYELCKKNELLGKYTYEIEELREVLGVGKGELKAWKDFRRFCLEPAIREINQKTDLQISYKAEKLGRRFKWVVLKISKKKDKQSIKAIENDSPISDLLKLLPEGERNKKTIQSALIKAYKKHGFEYCKRNIEYANEKATENYRVFLIKALKEDWALGWWEDKLQKEEKEKWYEKIKNAILKDEKGIEYKTNERGFIYLKKIDDRFVCLRDGVTPPPIVVDLVKKGKLKIVGNY